MKEMTIKKKSDKVEEELARGADVSIINLIDQLIEKADASRASDIHIDPLIEGVRIRFRIDGVLQDAYLFPKEINNEIISRIKILSKLRSDEHQMTQDGRFRYVLPGENKFIDFRVSIVPTYHGENAVLRLLTDKNEESTLEDLGFSESDRKKIENAIRKTNGMILSTGPTGSGKTTTMYTLIKMLNSPGVSIITIEDPIEYAIDEVEQIQVNSRFGLTFANGLRSILRQDPNIIMVGEIRDAETASIAVNTALTGHLLLSTLHTNDAATTLPRLLDMGIEEYLVASTVSIAIGQRLVRKICKDCKEKKPMTHGMKEALAQTPYASLLANNDFVYKGKGCE
ncbi:MAG: Type II secretion system protein E, partial [Candidatus Nomurabacteria bacterium GW2011_GWF2_43_8]